jgi:RNA polymerase sigma-70 factor (sigma-E family)
VSDDKIPPHDARELADCFAAHAGDLYGYAGVLARGDRARAGDLVQTAFQAGCRAWQVVRGLDEDQRRGWLRSTLAAIAVSGLRREAPPPDWPPRIEDCDQASRPDPPEQAFAPIVLERCWLVIQHMPERDHAVAVLRWYLDMKDAEIASALGMAESTVGAHLDRARRKLIGELEPDHAGTGDDPEHDVLLSRLYQQVTASQEARFRAGYDLTAGLDRYRAWLRAERSADLAVQDLYAQHYKSLVRLAAMLVRDKPTAEEVVQDAFVAMHGGWYRLEDTDKALAYLRQAVVNKSRSVLRHRVVVEKNLQNPPPDMPSAEHGAFAALERDEVVAALRKLPERQREAIVLRYYGDLSEADIAAAMGISRGAVKSHTARGMAALRAALEGQDEEKRKK